MLQHGASAGKGAGEAHPKGEVSDPTCVLFTSRQGSVMEEN